MDNKISKLVLPVLTALVLLISYGLYQLRHSGSAAAYSSQAEDLVERPNIVIIIADDLSAGDISVYGNNRIVTPRIADLAANGLVYENAFLTSSSCSASRASILTGLYPQTNGLVHLHQPLPGANVTLGKMLEDLGYYTAAIGKWHLGRPVISQFDLVADMQIDPGSQNWVSYLRQRPRGKPFFFWLASRDPHRPHEATEKSIALQYAPTDVEIPANMTDGPNTRAELATYYREVSRFDRDVGRVVDELRAQGVLDNTLVIVMADNGRPFHGAKITLADAGIRTPFIVSWPDRIHQGRREQLVSMVDLAPTLVELAGGEHLPALQGESFADTFFDALAPGRDAIFAVRNWHGTNAHERIVRTMEYAYKENQYPAHGDCVPSAYGYTQALVEARAAFKAGEFEGLYADCFAKQRPPAELRQVNAQGKAISADLSSSAEHEQIRADLARQLAKWREATGDFDYQPYEPPKK